MTAGKTTTVLECSDSELEGYGRESGLSASSMSSESIRARCAHCGCMHNQTKPIKLTGRSLNETVNTKSKENLSDNDKSNSSCSSDSGPCCSQCVQKSNNHFNKTVDNKRKLKPKQNCTNKREIFDGGTEQVLNSAKSAFNEMVEMQKRYSSGCTGHPNCSRDCCSKLIKRIENSATYINRIKKDKMLAKAKQIEKHKEKQREREMAKQMRQLAKQKPIKKERSDEISTKHNRRTTHDDSGSCQKHEQNYIQPSDCFSLKHNNIGYRDFNDYQRPPMSLGCRHQTRMYTRDFPIIDNECKQRRTNCSGTYSRNVSQKLRDERSHFKNGFQNSHERIHYRHMPKNVVNERNKMEYSTDQSDSEDIAPFSKSIPYNQEECSRSENSIGDLKCGRPHAHTQNQHISGSQTHYQFNKNELNQAGQRKGCGQSRIPVERKIIQKASPDQDTICVIGSTDSVPSYTDFNIKKKKEKPKPKRNRSNQNLSKVSDNPARGGEKQVDRREKRGYKERDKWLASQENLLCNEKLGKKHTHKNVPCSYSNGHDRSELSSLDKKSSTRFKKQSKTKIKKSSKAKNEKSQQKFKTYEIMQRSASSVVVPNAFCSQYPCTVSMKPNNRSCCCYSVNRRPITYPTRFSQYYNNYNGTEQNSCPMPGNIQNSRIPGGSSTQAINLKPTIPSHRMQSLKTDKSLDRRENLSRVPKRNVASNKISIEKRKNRYCPEDMGLPCLTPIPKPNLIEGLKRELITALEKSSLYRSLESNYTEGKFVQEDNNRIEIADPESLNANIYRNNNAEMKTNPTRFPQRRGDKPVCTLFFRNAMRVESDKENCNSCTSDEGFVSNKSCNRRSSGGKSYDWDCNCKTEKMAVENDISYCSFRSKNRNKKSDAYTCLSYDRKGLSNRHDPCNRKNAIVGHRIDCDDEMDEQHSSYNELNTQNMQCLEGICKQRVKFFQANDRKKNCRLNKRISGGCSSVVSCKDVENSVDDRNCQTFKVTAWSIFEKDLFSLSLQNQFSFYSKIFLKNNLSSNGRRSGGHSVGNTIHANIFEPDFLQTKQSRSPIYFTQFEKANSRNKKSNYYSLASQNKRCFRTEYFKMSNEITDYVDKDCSVRVAVRIRPQNSREKIDMCRVCAIVTPGEPQIILGLDKAFTFDYMFDAHSQQTEIYSTCVERLVEGALRGYNATVLAYGQTGSGKTYTMGTGFERENFEQHQGIIPRAVRHIFSGIEEMQTHANDDGAVHFSVAVQFLELYNEDIIDLLDPFSSGKVLKIHEDNNGQICVSGLTIKPINDPQDALKFLQQGALARTTASTQMNDQSSRSHALFTILIRRQRIISTVDGTVMPDADLETLTSKFHFVDLAGSERLKRTGATGERAREGISINSGLLCLGNCISALGDKSKKATHVPYRDSKLTRLLQDSLGGNSQTVMIACVSPSDRDFMETLNTLKYANRARNIKNKVQINQDQSSRTISQLRREIAALQLELLEYKQGKRIVDSEGNCSVSDTFHENVMLKSEQKRQQQRLKAMQDTINCLTQKNAEYKLAIDSNGWTDGDSDSFISGLVAGYITEIEQLKAQLIESEGMYQQLKKSAKSMHSPRSVLNIKVDADDPENLIVRAKQELEKERELLMSKSLSGYNEDDNGICEKNGSSENDDSDSDSDDKATEIQNDLNDINADIEIKTKLIEELERSQHRMQQMKHHYEEKFMVLNCKIANTQKERDDMLANISVQQGGQSNSEVKKVREDFEKKLNGMRREMKKLQQAQKEHTKQRREIQAQEAQLNNLRKEVADLKTVKVQLMRRMNEQTNRFKEEEKRKAREIAKLRKEQRKQLNTVKSLQSQMQVKEQILRRKTEEVSALRRNQRGALSEKAAGRVRKKTDLFDSRQARQRWSNFSRTISHLARNKQILMQLEKEMERLVHERETLSQNLTSIRNAGKVDEAISDLLSEEDTIKSNLNYVQESISNVQQAIMELEEGKNSNSKMIQEMQNLIGEVSNVEEAKFLLDRLSESAVMFSCSSLSSNNRLFELEALLSEAQQENSVQQQLLQHFLAQNDNVQISDLFDSLNLTLKKPECEIFGGSQSSLHSNGTYDIPTEKATEPQELKQSSTSRSPSPAPTIDLSYDKIRKRTAQPQDLLFGDREVNQDKNDIMTRSYTQRPDAITRNVNSLMRVPSAPGSLKQNAVSPSISKANDISQIFPTTHSPRQSRRQIQNKGSVLGDENFNSASSPPVYRKMVSREETYTVGNDVFSRLGAGQQDPTPGGSILKITGKVRVGAPLYCTHTVSGHSNAVLSLKINDNMLYTAAADRTVKVWDLSQEMALHCLSLHSGPVVALENDDATQLLFSASGPYVRVWDLRLSNTKPIRTLSSSGQILSGNTNAGTVPGESPVTALCLGSSGNLYVAASDKVRIWELKSLSCIGNLSGGHQAAVMCVSAWDGGGDGGSDFVATGSKDHYVKVFEVPKTGGLVYPLLHLEPPHYDGVQALAVAPNSVGAEAELFSGSRDSGIKRWDLKSGELKQSLNNAHKGWISGMAVSGDILLSSCRTGIIRLWNVKTCESLSEMKTDSAINDIVTSGQRVFTASSDGGVRMWRFSNALRRNHSVGTS